MADLVHGTDAVRWGGWSWAEPRRGEHFRRCSYCGSMHPEDVATEMKGGVVAAWADRKYGWPHKFYMHVPNRNPDAIFCVGGRSEASEGPYAPGGEKYSPPEPGLVAAADLTVEQREIALRDGMGSGIDEEGRYFRFGTRREHFGKFYTVHLADPGIADEVKEAVFTGCGLRFVFEDGNARWSSAHDRKGTE